MTGHAAPYVALRRSESMDISREEAIIRLEGLGKQFKTSNGTVTALEDINLDIRQGEIFGIIGLSGAGKSTLVRCINYLEEPTSGRVIFEGKNLSAMKEKDPKQALNNLDVVLPETVVDAVFDELQTSHPLLSHIQFMNTRGAIRMMMNTNGYQTAAWGPLCSEVVQELTSGFKEVDTSLLKLAAILPVCKAMLDLGRGSGPMDHGYLLNR